MAEVIQRISDPEIFIGIVAPIGTEIESTILSISSQFEAFGYNCVKIKVTDSFPKLEKFRTYENKLDSSTTDKRYRSYIKFGDDLRRDFADDAFLASVAIDKIAEKRGERFDDGEKGAPQKVVYIIRQFKRKEEVDILRTTYGTLFFQLSVYSMRSSRVDSLARQIASSHNFADPNMFRHEAESLVRIDETENDDDHGQRVSDVFHDADFIVNTDINEPTIDMQVSRFVNLLFGLNSISPTKMEYGMYIAKSASLRTIDLSRQVGAAIFSPQGEVISLGANEVPKGEGGTYWCDDPFDNRDYKRQKDSNRKRKKEILSELLSVLGVEKKIDDLLKLEKVKKSQFMDALEYGRIIHAEMSAICDSARIGRSLDGSILFCTTFPCHMCAKHIVASGIKTVVFLEPYPKSLASDLHGDSIDIEGHSRGGYSTYPNTKFMHFFGVSPRRYRDLFEKHSRKDKDGNFQTWKDGVRQPIVNIRLYPQYFQFEIYILDNVLRRHFKRKEIPFDALREKSAEEPKIASPEHTSLTTDSSDAT